MSKAYCLIENFREGDFRCFWKFLVSKNNAKLRYHSFSETIRLMVPKIFFGEKLFCASEVFWYRKTLCMKGVSPCFVENFFLISYSTDNFCRSNFLVFVITYLPVLVIDCTCMLQNIMPEKTITEMWKIRCCL